MKIVFIADVFADEVPGGGELVNQEVINLLRADGHTVTQIKSQDVNSDFVIQENSQGSKFILGNFLALKPGAVSALITSEYIIYEHDHKYLATRDPSKFKDYVAPKSQVVNEFFYNHAKAVLCQSKGHADIVTKNLPSANVVNMSCSVWDKDFVDTVESIDVNDLDRCSDTAILQSNNPTKNQMKAEFYCQKNQIAYDLINAANPSELFRKLTKYDSLVFFPSVYETFCRVVVEAKLAGCKIITNPNLLGVASEQWFSSNKEDILSKIKKAPRETVDTIIEIFEQQKYTGEETDITVILNSYRRPYNLKKQIDTIRSQTKKPKQIWVWVNHHEDNSNFDHSSLGADRVFLNDHNWKFYGRFAAALLADTEYVAVFDDDTIPGDRWFENCLDTMRVKEGILGSAGVILKNKDHYVMHDRCGWPTQNSDITRVDLVGHAWFFRRDWLQYLWKEKPFTWDNGEDIQFSYLAQKHGGIQTYCPPHPPEDKSLHGSILGNELGIDSKATSNNHAVSHQQFFVERDGCVQNGIRGGWKTVNKL